MLGTGRPFIVELVNPRKKLSLTQEILDSIAEKINKSVLVNVLDLRDGGSNAFDAIKESEKLKVKMYCCMVTTNKELSKEKIEELNSLQDISINQKTPLRVLHRRTLMNREKKVYKVAVKKVNAFCYVVFVLGSAGTYIKEFIHGDLERTLPNFGTLADCKADIFQLDVVDIFKTLDDGSYKKFQELCDEKFN